MIDRYTNKEIREIWTDENKFSSFLKVEIATIKAWNELGLISDEETSLIEKNAKFDIKRIAEIELETKHDVIAFTRSVSESLGDEGKWIHYGLTSTDVVDTAYGLQIQQANNIIEKDLDGFLAILLEKANQYKNVPIIGRTHGIHAEPTSFGLKYLYWYDQLDNVKKTFEYARTLVEAGKISGSVGNYANVDPRIQEIVMKDLGLNSARISTQVLSRERHAIYINSIALIGSVLEEIALEIRNLQRTEVREVEEYFDAKQKGSSSMPHKRNPISSENITGLSRVLRGYQVTAMQDIPLWHERDISHSSVERIIIPDATSLIDYMLKRMAKVLKNLIVYEDKMMEDINLTNGVIYSQKVLSFLIDTKGMSREEAYDFVQPVAIEAYTKNLFFKDLLTDAIKGTDIDLTEDELDKLFDVNQYLKEVDVIFDRFKN